MYFALCRCEIFIPDAGSLKAKRAVLNRVKERLRTRFHASVSEVDTQDLWQRGTLGIALVGLHPSGLEEGLAAMRRLIEDDPRCRVTIWETRVEPWDSAAGLRPPSGDDDEPAWDKPAADDELYGPMWNERRAPTGDGANDRPRPRRERHGKE